MASRAVIVVPCYNEEHRLRLDSFRDFLATEPRVDVLFVNDGSRDGTGARLAAFAATLPERVAILELEHNAGKAEAVRRGVAAAAERPSSREYIGYWDADLATPLTEIRRFLQLLDQRPEVTFVLGARVRLLGKDIDRRVHRHYLGRVFATFASLTLALPVYDTQCGAKLFRNTPAVVAAFARPFASSWIFDVELMARLMASGAVRPEKNGFYELSLDVWRDVAGSKVKPQDFFVALWQLGRIYQAKRRGRI